MRESCSLLLSSTGSRLVSRIIVSTALCLVLSSRAIAKQQNEEERTLATARAELRAGHAKSAEAIIRAQLANHDSPDLHRLLADCLEAEGDFKHAAEQYRAAAAADPSEDNLFAFGSELLKYRGYQQALQVFSYAAGQFPHSARVLVGFGIAQYSLGQYDRAVETLCRAVDLDPSDTHALGFLGKMIGVSPALSAEVRSRLQHFAALYPSNAPALYFYALSLQPEEETIRQTLLESAIKLQPKFPDAHYQLGITYQKIGQSKKAIAELRIAIQQQPTLRQAHYRLARLYLQAGQTDLAKQQYAVVKSLPPESPADSTSPR